MEISKGDPVDIAAFITALLERIDSLENRVKELERQLNQNSQNSSKPPSSDGFRKPTNLRKAGGKKGAPKGHKGSTLQMVKLPDTIVTHPLLRCSHCNSSLEKVPREGHERRQVFDLPQPRFVVTEHRTEKNAVPIASRWCKQPFLPRFADLFSLDRDWLLGRCI